MIQFPDPSEFMRRWFSLFPAPPDEPQDLEFVEASTLEELELLFDSIGDDAEDAASQIVAYAEGFVSGLQQASERQQ